MNPHLGDVQAPSPGPGATSDGANKKHHGRKHSARGLPPGSYGLHGHGVASQDKLDKAYYQKHPDVLEREQHTPLHDRQNDFAMSSTDLNKLVRDTASRQSAPGMAELHGTPCEEVAFQASEEYTSRISSSRPASVVPSQMAVTHSDATAPDAEHPIHVDDARHPEFYSCGNEDNVAAEEEHEYSAPILAPDQVNKDPSAQLQQPAIHPYLERRDSLEAEESSSRPTSRLGHNRAPSYQRPEFGSTPLEDVKEYEPLFSEEVKEERQRQEPADENHLRHHFPSRDVWEDAPSSVHYTAEVSTPERPEQIMRRPSTQHEDRPITPAQAFAQYQERLAEKEATGRTNSLPISEEKPTWISHQPHLSPQKVGKCSANRFPSRDVWEETPESQLQEAIVSGSPTDGDNPDSAARLAKKSSDPSETPAIPDRPKLRQSSGDNSVKPRPPVSDKPKPHVPPRPTKSSPGDSKDAPTSKSKPAVPSRPVGGKIAALQAGFMSDLNKRLQLGPQAPRKEDIAEDEVVEEEEKAPLSDARKGRARGPQRRAPAAKAPAAATSSPAAKASAITLTFSIPQTSWSLDPDDGDIAVGTENEATPDTGTEVEESPEPAHLDKADVRTGGQSQAGLVDEPQTMNLAHGATKAVAQGGELETPAQSSHAESEEKTETKSPEEPAVEDKTLVANMAGESVLEATVEKGRDGNEVEPVKVHDHVKA
ncbi:hypothetical protein OCS_03195 [Ophiocordyceps sinensis CO18]|nr:hypothetical protein OCS_03195 [Ophiocordyceps sinensis CO18]